MLRSSVPTRRADPAGPAQLHLVRRYARLLRETTAETATLRRSNALRTPPPRSGKGGEAGR
jgi:hypothetical protein